MHGIACRRSMSAQVGGAETVKTVAAEKLVESLYGYLNMRMISRMHK